MTVLAPPSRPLRDLRDLTPARVGLGRTGAGLPTRALLEFTLDHARARDAVHAAFDVPALIAGLGNLGLPTASLSSCARDRKDYLRRPDLGRKLDRTSQQQLAGRRAESCKLAIVVGDGLSPAAVNVHAVIGVAERMAVCRSLECQARLYLHGTRAGRAIDAGHVALPLPDISDAFKFVGFQEGN